MRNQIAKTLKPIKKTSILFDADRIINGELRYSYGPVEVSFANIAKMWSVLLRTEVTGSQVAQCMIALKQVREMAKPSVKNRMDMAGYAALLDELES